jgi:hypothetical protein
MGENNNFILFMKGGLVMSRKILAGLVVLTLVLLGSIAMADCGNSLTYQLVPSRSANASVVRVYLENSKGIAGVSVPLSFGTLGSDIQCTKIDFTGSRVEHFQKFPTIDNQNKRLLIGLIRDIGENIDDVLPAGEGLIATLYFSSQKSRCLPDLKTTPWPLSGGKLYFDMVNEKGYSICGSNQVDANAPIAIKPGGDEEIDLTKPTQFSLEPNYPNPFNPETVIEFSLPQDSRVNLKVYNVLGQVVTTLVDEMLPAGVHSVTWNGKNDRGSDVASGIFFYRIKAGNYESIQKMTLLR